MNKIIFALFIFFTATQAFGSTCEEDITELGVLVRMYVLDTGRAPTNEEGFSVVLKRAVNEVRLRDAEGELYIYEVFVHQNTEYVTIKSKSESCKYIDQFAARKVT